MITTGETIGIIAGGGLFLGIIIILVTLLKNNLSLHFLKKRLNEKIDFLDRPTENKPATSYNFYRLAPLIDYVKQCRKMGFSDELIRKKIGERYSIKDIDEIFKLTEKEVKHDRYNKFKFWRIFKRKDKLDTGTNRAINKTEFTAERINTGINEYSGNGPQRSIQSDINSGTEQNRSEPSFNGKRIELHKPNAL